jgi:non-heme chloroperoxidase
MIRRIEVRDGVTLPYVEHGDPSGVPVVLLHGYSDSWRSYELLLAELPETVHAFAITQRGHGDADRPASGYAPEDYAGDVLAFLDAVGLDAAVIVGHSGGSYTAQRFALDHPERTLGLVLIGAFRSVADKPLVKEMWDGVVSVMTDPVDPAFVREFQESCVAGTVPDGFIDAIVAESRKLPARVWIDYLRELIAAEVPTANAPIPVPGLILWGDQDLFCPRADQEGLEAAIPGSRLVTYAGVGHCPHWERPAAVAAELAAFAASLEGERSIAVP